MTSKYLWDGIPCYCPHHADGDEDCEGCLGCRVSRKAIAAERDNWERRLAGVGFHRGLTLEQNVA